MSDIVQRPEPEIDENDLCQVMETVFGRATDAICEFLENDTVRDIADCIKQLGSDVADAVGVIRTMRKIASIPSKLFLNKFVRYCEGLTDIPLEERQRYLTQLGREKFNQEGAFTLNVIQKIEEKEKIPFLLKLLEAQIHGIIDLTEYRRLMILVDRTLYSDLLYLKDHITADPVALHNEADYGLAASGLLVTAGNGWGNFAHGADSDMLFNYTRSAKKLAQILFEIQCSYLPTNVGIITVAEDDEVDDMLNSVLGAPTGILEDDQK